MVLALLRPRDVIRHASRFGVPSGCAVLFIAVAAVPARGQSPVQTDDSQVIVASLTSSASAQRADESIALDLAEPDFALINIPTTLRLPRHKGNFHLTHRFAGNLRSGTFGQQASRLFGIDEGAIIGFEYRFGVTRHLQAVAYRSSFDRTIQLGGKYDAVHQGAAKPVSLSALASIEGGDNFQTRFLPALGGVVSRKFQDRLAVYAAPMWVHNSAAGTGVDRDTFYVGLGGRLRVTRRAYLVGEFSPRAAGYAPGQAEYGFGAEARIGKHLFQLTFTNTSGTTLGQIAQGGSSDALYLGFNLTRKFF